MSIHKLAIGGVAVSELRIAWENMRLFDSGGKQSLAILFPDKVKCIAEPVEFQDGNVGHFAALLIEADFA